MLFVESVSLKSSILTPGNAWRNDWRILFVSGRPTFVGRHTVNSGVKVSGSRCGYPSHSARLCTYQRIPSYETLSPIKIMFSDKQNSKGITLLLLSKTTSAINDFSSFFLEESYGSSPLFGSFFFIFRILPQKI